MMMILLLVVLPPLDRYIVRDTPTRITHDTHDTPRASDPRYIPMIPDLPMGRADRAPGRLAWSRGVDSVRRRWMETSTKTSHDDDDDDDKGDKGDDDDDLG